MLSFIKRRKIALIIGLVIIIILIITFRSGGNEKSEAFVVNRGELVRTVELAGKVVPVKEADLAFEVSGTVSAVYKDVGDTVSAGEAIVSLDVSGTQADLLKAEADLAAARAELAKLEGSGNPLALITNSKTDVAQAIIDAYTKADDAVYNRVDQFFDDPRSGNPEILFAFDDIKLRNKIDANRIIIGEILAKWKSRVAVINAANYTDEDLKISEDYLRQITSFLTDVANAVNDFETNSALTQATIDAYKSDVSTARQNINTAFSSLIQAEQGLLADLSDAPVQAARVSAAEATVANYRVRLSKMVLRAPISGIISNQDAKKGETLSANTNVVSVISADRKIEAYVPEVSVAGMAIGAPAVVTLDAYGGDVEFPATVSHIDPRETVRDGVSTYKIDLLFKTVDERALSGMTSNISIETLRKPNVILIPERAVLKEGKNSYVMMKMDKGGVEKVSVWTGISDTSGNVEVTQGVGEGATIYLTPKK